MLTADLYIDKIDLAKYLTREDCAAVGAREPAELARRLRTGELDLAGCLFFPAWKRYALSLALRAAEVLPPVPSLELPRPVSPDLYEINQPGPEALVLVTGNSEFTLTVLTALLALTVSPFFLLLVDCRGDTVDMAMVYGSFTPERLKRALAAHGLAARVSHRRLLVSGWCEPIVADLSRECGWEVTAGPVCVAELPLFLGDGWQPPPGALD
jgi:CO dehydrogenase/acetyl-CoA synthase gamma subunit (corrinoid Fe-S protein)|uniref:CO dehydrogenase/acetyl-CoA synthase delta subunit TIM barrel domain-containing protein n=1 Tax=Desulfobacca acetoxidans TaxID=60893 RepID=A0A7C5ALV4_9BACT